MPRAESAQAEQGWGASPGVLFGVGHGECTKPTGDADQTQAEGFKSAPPLYPTHWPL